LGCSCTTKLTNSSSISVSIRSPLQSFPRLTEVAREPKPTARPDVVKASEGHFPQQARWPARRGGDVGRARDSGGGAWGMREGVRVSSGDPRVMSGCTNLKHWKLIGKKSCGRYIGFPIFLALGPNHAGPDWSWTSRSAQK
jgi:hypothetical protein